MLDGVRKCCPGSGGTGEMQAPVAWMAPTSQHCCGSQGGAHNVREGTNQETSGGGDSSVPGSVRQRRLPHNMCSVITHDLIQWPHVDAHRQLVRHRPRRDKHRRLLPKKSSNLLLQLVHCRVIAKDVIANPGMHHRLKHGGCRSRNRVRTEVEKRLGAGKVGGHHAASACREREVRERLARVRDVLRTVNRTKRSLCALPGAALMAR
jgi:hypothetical protein